MEQYINKDAIIEEIKKLKEKYASCSTHNSYEEGLKDGRLIGYKDALYKINNIEVKEVDLDDSTKENLAQKYMDYTVKKHNINPDSKEGQLIYYSYIHGMNQCLNQLKKQKGE